MRAEQQRGGARTQDAGTVTMSSSQRKGTAKFGGVVAEDSISGASAEHTGAQEEAVAYNLHVLHVVDQLQNGNCGALALCVLFLALGICCFTLGVFTLAMNEFFLGRMLRAAHGLLNASAWRCQPYSLASSGLARLLIALHTPDEQLSRAGPKLCGRSSQPKSPILREPRTSLPDYSSRRRCACC